MIIQLTPFGKGSSIAIRFSFQVYPEDGNFNCRRSLITLSIAGNVSSTISLISFITGDNRSSSFLLFAAVHFFVNFGNLSSCHLPHKSETSIFHVTFPPYDLCRKTAFPYQPAGNPTNVTFSPVGIICP